MVKLMGISYNNSTNTSYNIGTTDEISIERLYYQINKMIPSFNIVETSTKITHGHSYEDLQRRVPDNSRLTRVTNWDAKIDLEVGLEKTISWVEANNWWLELDSEFR
jgi:UDP-glucose 4-epimerase